MVAQCEFGWSLGSVGSSMVKGKFQLGSYFKDGRLDCGGTSSGRISAGTLNVWLDF